MTLLDTKAEFMTLKLLFTVTESMRMLRHKWQAQLRDLPHNSHVLPPNYDNVSALGTQTHTKKQLISMQAHVTC